MKVDRLKNLLFLYYSGTFNISHLQYRFFYFIYCAQESIPFVRFGNESGTITLRDVSQHSTARDMFELCNGMKAVIDMFVEFIDTSCLYRKTVSIPK